MHSILKIASRMPPLQLV